jgi:hypothetical protein
MARVSAVNEVEMIRDGGSFSAWFLDTSRVEHTLWFPIAFRAGAPAGHGEPFVARVVRFAGRFEIAANQSLQPIARKDRAPAERRR